MSARFSRAIWIGPVWPSEMRTGMAQRFADLTFEVSNTRFAGAMLDDIAKRFLGNLDLPGLNSVCLHPPRHEIAASNLEFFVGGVPC